jgi:hypothetical protein
MLSSLTSKYLSESFEEKQNQCFKNKDHFSADEQSYYDLTGNGYWDYLQVSFTIDAVHSGSEPHRATVVYKEAIDLRKRPECGD